MRDGLDDNDLLREGRLPADPAEGTGPAPELPREETPEEQREREKQEAAAKAEALLDAQALMLCRPAITVLGDLIRLWEHPPPVRTTGIRQLDAILTGGLRGGDLIGVGGEAKSGKSALAGQIGFDFARHVELDQEGQPLPRGLLVYVSNEMRREEVLARWITRLAFAITLEERTPWVSYSSVLYGKAFRAEATLDPDRNRAISKTLVEAMQLVSAVVGPADTPNIRVLRAQPGTTPWDVRRVVRAARALLPKGTPVLCIVDPLQRLFAGPSGMLSGRVLEQANADPNTRPAWVAAQLKTIAEEDDVAFLVTSDTTKEAVRTSAGSKTGIRGSYEVNHWLTAILGMHVQLDPHALAARVAEGAGEGRSKEDIAQRLLASVPSWFETSVAAQQLHRRYVYLDVSGNRNGPDDPIYLGQVKGAMSFVERSLNEEV